MITLIIRNQEEAQPLLQLAQKAAKKMEKELQVVVMQEVGPSQIQPVSDKSESWIQEIQGDVLHCGGEHRYAVVERYLESEKVGLLILGKHLHSKAENADTRFSRRMYESLGCQTLLVRLGDQMDKPWTKERHQALPEEEVFRSPILVSCGAGTHTVKALQLAYALAGEDMVAFHLGADVDEHSQYFADQNLRKLVKRSGVNPDQITLKTTLGDDVPQALREQVEAGHEGAPYAMVLLGYSQARGLREKLFGTIPDKLVNKSGGLTIGVIKAAQPIGNRMMTAVSKLVRLRVPQLERDERIALFDEIELKSRWSFDFAALMTLAALVAGLGLLANSGAVVIGAMLIAPLMMPLIGSGLALAQGHGPLFKNAFLAVVRGFFFALLTGILLGVVAQIFHIPLTDELAARGRPNLLDLGVAFVSGIAASYCIARPTLTGALAGVSIAAALVPPIVTVGISLVIGENQVASGASLLFGTNVVAVILGASLNFILGGIKGRGKSGDAGRRFIFVLALICLGLAAPLSAVLLQNIPRSEMSALPQRELVEDLVSVRLPSGYSLVSMDRELRDEVLSYALVVAGPEVLSRESFTVLKEHVQQAHKLEVALSVQCQIVLR